MDLKQIKEEVCELTKEVGRFQVSELQKFDRNKIISKGYNDPVSYVDKESEIMLVAGLKKILPEAGFLTEEETENYGTDGLHWVIDPLDGTNNYVHQVPFFGISVALCNAREILVGVVNEPNREECFSAYLGGGAFLNKDKISVSACYAMKDSLIATGFPYSLLDKTDKYFEIMKDILRNSHGLRRFGSAAMDLCFVACGRFDGYFEFNLHPYDVMAGALIVREAGGAVTDFSGNLDIYDGMEILATSGFQEEFRKMIVKHW